MSIADDKPRRRRMPVFGERRKAPCGAGASADSADGGAPAAGRDAPPVVSGRMRAMLAAAPQDEPEERQVGDETPAAAPAEAVAPDAPPARPVRPATLRAACELRPAVSESMDDCAPDPPPAAPRPEEADPDAPSNRAISLAIRLGSMMAVVLAGVFAATLVDLALGLKTRFQGLGILATYLVVLAVILTPTLNPQTRRQWIVVIGGFAGVILAIALGSAVARLMLMTKDFQHTGFYVHLAVEFGVMFAFWGLASLVFAEVLRSAGIKISGGPDDPS